MRKVDKIVGTEFTRRKTTHNVAETPDEFREVVRQMREWMEDPWADRRLDVEAARVALELEIAAKPEGYCFKEREDTGWYMGRLITLGALVQHHIDAGATSWAAHHAVLFGEMFCELQMKLKREREWITGKKIHDGGTASRCGNQADRLAAVEAHCAEPDPLSRREAFRRVAESEGVTAKAIEADYYKAKKLIALNHVIGTFPSR